MEAFQITVTRRPSTDTKPLATAAVRNVHTGGAPACVSRGFVARGAPEEISRLAEQPTALAAAQAEQRS